MFFDVSLCRLVCKEEKPESCQQHRAREEELRRRDLGQSEKAGREMGFSLGSSSVFISSEPLQAEGGHLQCEEASGQGHSRTFQPPTCPDLHGTCSWQPRMLEVSVVLLEP